MGVGGPAAIASVPRARIAVALREVCGPDVGPLVQVGTNLPFASNPVACWHALRRAGMADRHAGAGRIVKAA